MDIVVDAEFWSALGAIAGCVSAIATVVAAGIVVVAAFFAKEQLEEAARSRSLAAYYKVLEELGTPELVKARFDIYSQPQPPTRPDPTRPDLIKTARDICLSFDRVGLLVHEKLIPATFVLQMYYGAIIRCYQQLQPYREWERQNMKMRYMFYFKELYLQAVEYRNTYYPQDNAFEIPGFVPDVV